MIGIYIITNKINNKKYIGQSTNIKERLRKHRYAKENSYFHKAIRKYGWDNFLVEIIECDEKVLDEKEKEFIAFYNTTNQNKGYNLDSGGHKNRCLTEEARKNISENHADFNGDKNPFYGKHHSEETILKISESQKGEKSSWYGKKHTEESKRKMSEVQSGENHPMYGKHHSENTKIKISQNNAKYNLGKHLSEETKKKISDAHKSKKLSDETKAKLSKVRKSSYNQFRGKGYLIEGDKNPHAKKVVCIETGEIFNCMLYACQKYNINKSCLVACCKGRQKTAGGYHWKYYVEEQAA